MDTILGKKRQQGQSFLTDGKRLVTTKVEVINNSVICFKTKEKDGYNAIQLGFGQKKHGNKASLGHSKKGANIDYAPNFLREVRLSDNVQIQDLPQPGSLITALSFLKPGDIISVTGVSKGKGFAGVVKRHNFRGGPRTHGQSDRERAPGSIGQTTTPGRVYKGKRMAGRMGGERVTVQNLQVLDVMSDGVLIGGVIPGAINSLVSIKKVKENAKFLGLFKANAEKAIPEEVVKK